MGGTKKDKKKTAEDANVFLIGTVIAVGGLLFFTMSIWLRTPDEKIVHQAAHKVKKKAAAPKRTRGVSGYSVAYRE